MTLLLSSSSPPPPSLPPPTKISRGKPNKPIFVAHELGKSLLWMIIILSSSSNETRRQVLAVGMSQSTSKASTGPCVISAEQALSIFLLARQHHCALHLAARLDPQVGISGKAIQDIWSLRTWTHVTRAHWTSADHDRYTRKQQRKRKQHAEFSQHIKLEEGLSLGSSGTSSGHGSVDHSSGNADSQDPHSEPVQGLLTLPSSSLLSSSALATMEDMMEFLDAERDRESVQSCQYAKAEGEAETGAFKQNSQAYCMLSSSDSAKQLSIYTIWRVCPELTLCQD